MTEINIKGMETNSGKTVSPLALRERPNEDFSDNRDNHLLKRE